MQQLLNHLLEDAGTIPLTLSYSSIQIDVPNDSHDLTYLAFVTEKMINLFDKNLETYYDKKCEKSKIESTSFKI